MRQVLRVGYNASRPSGRYAGRVVSRGGRQSEFVGGNMPGGKLKMADAAGLCSVAVGEFNLDAANRKVGD